MVRPKRGTRRREPTGSDPPGADPVGVVYRMAAEVDPVHKRYPLAHASSCGTRPKLPSGESRGVFEGGTGALKDSTQL